ncbi:MAG: hypothetical protein ACOY94_22110 [Bacillota bacterium]
MPRLAQHELLDLQEHIRGEAATAQCCRQFAQMATDPDLRSFCEEESRSAEANVRKLMSLLGQGQTH